MQPFTPTSPATTAPRGRPLPHRPRVLPGLPVLHRMPGETQIGTHLRHAVVISNLSDPLACVLHSLDGRRTSAELLARAGPDRPTLRSVLVDLTDLGLVDDAASPDQHSPPNTGELARLTADRTAWMLRAGNHHSAIGALRERTVVVVQGSGRIAVAVAALLASSGVGWVHTVADGVVQPEDIGSGYLDEDIGHARAEAAERAVRRIASTTRTGRPDPRQRPDLVLLTDATVADPLVATRLAAAGIPHLMVHAAEGAGVVGPLVVPGRTSCLRCVNLHHTDLDPCWPAIAAQLADQPQPADLASVQATAAFAAGQALLFLHGSATEPGELPVWGATVEIDVFTSTCRRVEWEPHDRCACGAASRIPSVRAQPDEDGRQRT